MLTVQTEPELVGLLVLQQRIAHEGCKQNVGIENNIFFGQPSKTKQQMSNLQFSFEKCTLHVPVFHKLLLSDIMKMQHMKRCYLGPD